MSIRPRKKKEIVINDKQSLQGLMQEVYNDSCNQINDAVRGINELVNGSKPETVSDVTSIAKEKANLLKVKDSAIKVKLEVAKLQLETIKNNGNAEEAGKSYTNSTSFSLNDFEKIQDVIKAKADSEAIK